MGSCSTCKHWLPPDVDGYERHGECAVIECGEFQDARSAYVEYYEHNTARLRSLPTFGCTMHQQKTGPHAYPTDIDNFRLKKKGQP
jgi:hypothetical protein